MSGKTAWNGTNDPQGTVRRKRRMPINYESLMAMAVEDQPVSYTDRDAMLYALGVGFCGSPNDTKELRYAYEAPQLKTVPTMASMLLSGDFISSSGLDEVRVLL
ncbi:MAG TPA: hypothetical protein VNQ14_14970, partial [Woeseiaceae bacterium]|nr:hypothetical protein [Woeseiaceae bacterium]